MASNNHTPIDHIVTAHNNKSAVQHHSRPAESEPLSPSKNNIEVQQVVEHTITDPQVQPHVEVRKDIPMIPPDLKNMGITTTASTSFPAYQSLKLPLDEKKLPTALHSPMSESIRWLGEFTQYLIYQSKGTMQTAHKNIIANFIRLVGKDFGK